MNIQKGTDRLLMYEPPPSSRASRREAEYQVTPICELTGDQREELERLLRVSASPYTAYPAFLAEVRALWEGEHPAVLRQLRDAIRDVDLADRPVLYLKNCPVGELPELDFDDPRGSKLARKKDFVAEAFHALFSLIHETEIITHKTSSYGDMFHDITGKKSLQYSHTHKTLNTIGFHRDLPYNKVVPDWVYLLSLRNSPANVVYTPVVRIKDALACLSRSTRAVLSRPIFRAPTPTVSGDMRNYGLTDAGFSDPGPIIDGRTPGLAFVEGLTESTTEEGAAALAELTVALHSTRFDLFLEERDFVAMNAQHSIHARHVVEINDLEEHRRRWILKTWIVNDAGAHRQHFIPGLINTSDE